MTPLAVFTILLTFISSGIAWSLLDRNKKNHNYVMIDESKLYTMLIFLNKFVLPFVILLFYYKWWQAIIITLVGAYLISGFLGEIILTILSPLALSKPFIREQLQRQLKESKNDIQRGINIRLIRKEKISRLTPLISVTLNILSFVFSLICIIL